MSSQSRSLIDCDRITYVRVNLISHARFSFLSFPKHSEGNILHRGCVLKCQFSPLAARLFVSTRRGPIDILKAFSWCEKKSFVQNIGRFPSGVIHFFRSYCTLLTDRPSQEKSFPILLRVAANFKCQHKQTWEDDLRIAAWQTRSRNNESLSPERKVQGI